MANKKIDLILAAREMIQHRRFSECTIKEIAKEASCTSAVIYRHFTNLDQLLLTASVYFLEEYARAAIPIVEKNYHPLDQDRILWNEFANIAFHNVEAFDYLFWRFPQQDVEACIYDYYQFFPEQWRSFNGLYTSMFFGGDLRERNVIMLRWAATSGVLRPDDVPFIAELQCTYLYGLMMEIRETYLEPGIPEKTLERFNHGIREIHSIYRLDQKRN